MKAQAAKKTFDLLAALAAADSLTPFAADSALSAAKELTSFSIAAPGRYPSYREALEEHDPLGEISRAVCSGWMLWFASEDAPDRDAANGVAALSNALSVAVRHHRTWASVSSHGKQPLRSLAAAGVLAAIPTVAGKLAATLDRHSSSSAGQQQQGFSSAVQHYSLSCSVFQVWQAISNLCQPSDMLTKTPLAATLQPVAGLAFTVIRCGQSWRAAGVPDASLRDAVVEALGVACKLADTIDSLAEMGEKLTVVSCVEQLLSAADYQQLLFVYIGSLTASLYRHRNGQHKVSVTGAAEPAMQLDVPPWHQKVLQDSGADWAGQLLPESVLTELNTVKSLPSRASMGVVVYQHQLGRALCAAEHALRWCGCTVSPEQLDRMLPALLRMLVEISALLPHVTISKYCTGVAISLLSENPQQVGKLAVPCGGTSEETLVDAKTALVTARQIPTATAAGMLGPVLNLLAPSVLHVLALDSQAALQQYMELYDYGNLDMVGIARLALVINISTLLGMLMLPLQSKHLTGIILHKPLTSFSVLEAAIRSLAAEAITPGSRNTSLGQFSQFAMQQRAAGGPHMHRPVFQLATKVVEALQLAATEGRLASTMAAPPAGIEQQRWADMLSRQLSGLLVTCMKLLQVVGSREVCQDPTQHDYGLLQAAQAVTEVKVIGQILSISLQAAKLLSEPSSDPVKHEAPSKAIAPSDSNDAGRLWAVVAGRALRLLGQAMSTAVEFCTLCLPPGQSADDHCNQRDKVDQQQTLMNLLPRLSVESRVFLTAAEVVEWLTNSVRTCSAGVPSSVQEQLVQQQEQLNSGLVVADLLAQQAVAAGDPVPATAKAQQLVCPLPELLLTFGSTACTWLPQQQWCTNLQWQNLGMLRENVIVIGQGKLCSECRSVRYCSRQCQVQDWKNQHKHACKVLKVGAAVQHAAANTQ